MKTTKYLIPTLKPNQFDPIAIAGEWMYYPETGCWICRNAVPRCYSDMPFSSRCLREKV